MKVTLKVAQEAADEFRSLNDEQFAELVKLDRYLFWHRISHEPIDDKILPLFYKLHLFVGSTVLRNIPGGLEWAMSKDKNKYQDLDLATTLALLTAVLARGNPHGYGADYWYSKGVTRKLFSHLVKLRSIAS